MEQVCVKERAHERERDMEIDGRASEREKIEERERESK